MRLMRATIATGVLLSACHHASTAPGETGTGKVKLAATVPIPPNYGIHDTFVRDGIAFVSAWNSGIMIYDVGNGSHGGSPTKPVLVGQLVTSADSVPGGPQVHNSWWFWNPNTGEKKYLFVDQEGPAVGGIGVGSSGDVHVVDVSDLTHPVEVAFFHLANAGAHNVWMDEPNQILYAAYYNAGVVALDVSGTLPRRPLLPLDQQRAARRAPATPTPGACSSTTARSMRSTCCRGSGNSGRLRGSPGVAGGGNNVPTRYSSDLSVDTTAGYVYTGTWDHSERTGLSGSVVSVWHLGAGAARPPSWIRSKPRTWARSATSR